LAKRAAQKEGPEQDRLYVEAFGKFAEALRIKPDKYEAFGNWGSSLVMWAECKEGPEKDRLYAEAFDKFAEAVRINPDYQFAIDIWGNALFEWAKHKDGPEKDKLFARAKEQLSKSEQLKTGAGAYNLGCLASLQGDSASCRQWLEVLRDCKCLPSCDHLRSDEDLSSIRGESWFVTFMEDVCG
jgi:tetratricopeptide (TPR) repeat protein